MSTQPPERPGFSLHARLLEDCHLLGRLTLCHVLLHRTATLPWFILVPEHAVAALQAFAAGGAQHD